MRRPVFGSGRLAPLDGGSSRRSGVMRLCSSEQPAHISLIRRRSRSLVSRAPASSGIYLRSPAQCLEVNLAQEIEGAVTNYLTAGPSISAVGRWRSRLPTANVRPHTPRRPGAPAPPGPRGVPSDGLLVVPPTAGKSERCAGRKDL